MNNFDKELEKIEPTQEDFISRRINHLNFAKIIFWLCAKSQTTDFVYSSELSKFMKISLVRAYVILRELSNVEILRRKIVSSNLIEFYFVKNDGESVVLKYLERAKKTLDLI